MPGESAPAEPIAKVVVEFATDRGAAERSAVQWDDAAAGGASHAGIGETTCRLRDIWRWRSLTATPWLYCYAKATNSKISHCPPCDHLNGELKLSDWTKS